MDELCCIFCRQICDNHQRLFEHLMTAHDQKKTKCRFCRRYFFNYSDLKEHAGSHESSEKMYFKCAICSVLFQNKEKLFQHQLRHEKINGYEEGFTVSLLNAREYLENDKIHCFGCNGEFDSFVHFFQHKNKDRCAFVDVKKIKFIDKGQIDIKENVCDPINDSICIDRTDTKLEENSDSIEEFLDLTAKKRNLKTKECVENEMKRSSIVLENSLNNDCEVMNDEKTLKVVNCSLCDSVFTDSRFLKKHMATHMRKLGKCKYQCKYCLKGYVKPSTMFGHFRKKHKFEKPFLCKICLEAFSTKMIFSKHIKDIHNNDGCFKFENDLSIVYEKKIDKDKTVSIKNASEKLQNEGRKAVEASSKELPIEIENRLCESNKTTKELNATKKQLKSIINKNNIMSEKDLSGNITESNDLILVINNNDDFRVGNDSVESVPSLNNDGSVIEIDEGSDKDEFEVEYLESAFDNQPDIEFLNVNETCNKPNKRIKENKYIHCQVCDKKVLTVSMRYHLQRHKKTKVKHKCHLCGRRFIKISHFHLHVKKHFKEDRFLCSCGVKLASQKELEQHKTNVHSEKADGALLFFKKGDEENEMNYAKNSYKVLIVDADKKCQILDLATPENANLDDVSKNLVHLQKMLLMKNVLPEELDDGMCFNNHSESDIHSTSVPNQNGLIIKRISREEADSKKKFSIKINSVEYETNKSNKSLEIICKSVSTYDTKTNDDTTNVLKSKSDPKTIFDKSNSKASVGINNATEMTSRSSNDSFRGRTRNNHASLLIATENDYKLMKRNLKRSLESLDNTAKVFQNIKLVNSNPLAHLLGDNSVLTEKCINSKRCKDQDYLSIIKKSLMES